MVCVDMLVELPLTDERCKRYNTEHDPELEPVVDAKVEARIEYGRYGELEISELYEIYPDNTSQEISTNELTDNDYCEIMHEGYDKFAEIKLSQFNMEE